MAGLKASGFSSRPRLSHIQKMSITLHHLANHLLLRSNCILDALRCHCHVVVVSHTRYMLDLLQRRQPTSFGLLASGDFKHESTTFLILATFSPDDTAMELSTLHITADKVFAPDDP